MAGGPKRLQKAKDPDPGGYEVSLQGKALLLRVWALFGWSSWPYGLPIGLQDASKAFQEASRTWDSLSPDCCLGLTVKQLFQLSIRPFAS